MFAINICILSIQIEIAFLDIFFKFNLIKLCQHHQSCQKFTY